MPTKHYVELLYPGAFMPETEIREVKSRTVEAIGKIPEGCFAFYFFDRTEAKAEEDGEILRGKPKNESNKYYPKGTLYNLEEVKALNLPGHIVSNMESNNWSMVIMTHRGNWQPFEEGDILLEEIPK